MKKVPSFYKCNIIKHCPLVVCACLKAGYLVHARHPGEDLVWDVHAVHGCSAAALQCCSAHHLQTTIRVCGDTGRALAAGSCLLSVTGDVSVATQAGTLCIIVQLAAITIRATIRVTIRD